MSSTSNSRLLDGTHLIVGVMGRMVHRNVDQAIDSEANERDTASKPTRYQSHETFKAISRNREVL
jgi:hypothetical protein